MTTDETGVRSDDVKVRWSFHYNGVSMFGMVTIHRTDWGMASVEDRKRLIRDEVATALLSRSDVAWTITNARIDDPNY